MKKGNLIKKIKLGVKKLNHQEKQYFGVEEGRLS